MTDFDDQERVRTLAKFVRDLIADLRRAVGQDIEALSYRETGQAYARVKRWDQRVSTELRRVGFDDAAASLELIPRREPMISGEAEFKRLLRDGVAKRTAALEKLERQLHPSLVFVGHGRSPIWNRITRHLKDDLHLAAEDWESVSRAGYANVEVLKDFLARATFAVIVVTAEDLTADDQLRARQNVVHEIGLFQGRLGFHKVALLVQEGVEEFSNLSGLQTIRFAGDDVTAAFYDLGRMLERENVLSEREPTKV